MRTVYREKRYYCGEYLDVYIFPVFETGKRRLGRGKKRKPTSAAQKKLNQRHREQKLARLLHANFTPDDLELNTREPVTMRGVLFAQTGGADNAGICKSLLRVSGVEEYKGLYHQAGRGALRPLRCSGGYRPPQEAAHAGQHRRPARLAERGKPRDALPRLPRDSARGRAADSGRARVRRKRERRRGRAHAATATRRRRILLTSPPLPAKQRRRS